MNYISHRKSLEHGNSIGVNLEEEADRKNISKRVVRNLEERNVGTKGKTPDKA